MSNENETEEEQRAAYEPEREPAKPAGEVTAQAGEAWNRLKKRDMKQTMLLAFVIGVLFHACVVYAVLGTGEKDSGSTGGGTTVTSTKVPATATPTLNRQDCALIRGTDYKSEEERLWFQANCRVG